MSNNLKHVAPPLLKKASSKDPLNSSWRTHMKDGEWVPDVAVSECMLCRADFSFWSRKHHCRRCGAVVCFSCSGSRTKFIYKEVTPTNVANEECRVCDGCIRYIDEKLALGLSKRFGKAASADSDENQDGSNGAEEQEAAFLTQVKPLPAEVRNNRGVLTVGRYRYDCDKYVACFSMTDYAMLVQRGDQRE